MRAQKYDFRGNFSTLNEKLFGKSKISRTFASRFNGRLAQLV